MFQIDKAVVSLSWKNWENADGTTRFSIEASVSSSTEDGGKLYAHFPVYPVREIRAKVKETLEAVEKITGSAYGVFDVSGLFSVIKGKEGAKPCLVLKSCEVRKTESASRKK